MNLISFIFIFIEFYTIFPGRYMDSLDLKILAALQEDARRRNIDLAQELGVAPSTALERVRRLDAQGCFRCDVAGTEARTAGGYNYVYVGVVADGF